MSWRQALQCGDCLQAATWRSADTDGSTLQADRAKGHRAPVRNIAPKDAAELDAVETREWLDSLDYVLQSGGPAKVARLLRELTLHATENGVKLPFTANTPYINTIPADEQALMPGSPDLERRIKSLVRWNAAAMVVRANKAEEGIGGHISTFASAATLYEVGFNHFFRGHDSPDADIIFFQGHAAPGIYARAYLEGRIDETHLENFRRELKPGRRPVVVSASVADARLLGVPDGLDGPRPDHGDLPGALHALPRGSRPEAEVRPRRSGRSSATARPTSPNRSAPSRCRRARSSTT